MKALLALVALISILSAEVKLPEKKELYLFLLAGQSNMAGRGKLDAAAKKPVPKIFALNKKLEWQPAIEPLHWDKGAAGVGVGRTFAEIVLVKNPGVSIGLIPAACGGSSITSWVPGGYHDQTKSHPYDDAIARAKLAMNSGILKGILWHQGESDSNQKSAAHHEQCLSELINRFRKDLDAPDLPVIIGELGRFPGKPDSEGRDALDAAQKSLAEKMTNVAFVSSEGFTSDDSIHFDTKSVRIFAKRYADAYLELTR